MAFSWTQYLLDNASSGGSSVRELPGGFLVLHPTISWPIFNWGILKPHCDPNSAVPELIRALADSGCRASLAIPEDDAAIEAAAAGQKLIPHETHYVYCRDARIPVPARPANDRIAIAGTRDAQAWLELLMDGFEIPEDGRSGFRKAHRFLCAGDNRAALFRATVDGRPAGAAILWHEHGTGGLNTASVSPEWRRRGVHSALFAARIDRALELGASHLATETAEPPVMRVAERWGFEVAARFRFWY